MEHIGTSGAASAPEAHSPVQRSEEGGLHVASTSEMPEELSPLTDYLSDLTDKEWVDFCRATADPVSKEQFFKLCVNLVQHVTTSSVTVVVPALMKLLREDPQQFLPSPAREAEASGPSLRCTEEEQYIALLSNAVLRKAVSKVNSGKTQDASSSDSPHSSEERSQFSSLNQFGITEEGLQRSVQETLKELNVVGCQADTEELTNAIVREAVMWVNTSLVEFNKTVPNESENPAPRNPFSTEEYVEKIRMKLDSQKGAQGAMQQLLCWTRCKAKCSSEEDLVLSSTVVDSMTVVISTIESGLDEQSSVYKPAKCLLSTVMQAVKTLACQSSSLSDVFLSDTDLYGGSVESITQAGSQTQAVQPGMQALYSGDFLLKASKAVSSVLVIKMKQFHSAHSSATYLCATDTQASVASSISETDHSPEVYLQPVEETASMVVETFVEKMMAIALSECVDENEGTIVHSPLDGAHSIKKMTPDVEKNPAWLAAKQIFGKVHKTLEDFFIQMPSKLSQTIDVPRSDETPQQNDDDSKPDDDSTLDFTQKTSSSSEELPQSRTVSHSQLQQVQSEGTQPSEIAQPELDTCTSNVLREVIASYQQQQAAQPEDTSLSSTAINGFVQNVISHLSDMTSFQVASDDDLMICSPQQSLGVARAGSKDSLSVASVQILSSTAFQRNAFDAVVDVLVMSVKSNSSFQSFGFRDSTENRGMPKHDVCSFLPLEAEIKNADAAASEIVDQFARDMQMCIESLQSLSISNKSDLGSPEGEGKCCEMESGSLKSAQGIPKKEFTSAALKMYKSVQDKVREFFPRLSFKRKQQYEHLDEIPSKDNIFDLSKAIPAHSDPQSESEDLPVATELQDCTNEVMGELLMAVKEQIAEDQTSCSEGKISPAGSYLAANIMLEIENNLCLSTSGHSLRSSAEKSGSAEFVRITEINKNLSSEEIQTKAVNQVSQVLLNSAKSSGTLSTLSPESTAYGLVRTVVEGIQTLLQSTEYDAMDTDSKWNSKGGPAVSLEKSQVEEKASKVKIWSATKEMFGNLQGKVKEFFTKSQLHGSKVEDNACAEETNNNVIIGTEKDVPEFGPQEHDSEDLQQFHDTVNAVFQSLGEVDVQQAASASSSAPKRKLSPLNQETLPGVLPVLSEMPSETPFTNIDLHEADDVDDSDDTAVDESAAGITQDTMVDVVKAILEKVDLGDPSSSHAQGLTSVAQGLERSMSSSSVNSSSQDLIDQIYGIFMRSTNTTTERCADTVLLNQGQRKESGIPVPSQILHIYIEESVKHLLLSCFKLPSPWSVNKDGSLQPAQTSNTCPGSLTDMTSNSQAKIAATKSPSQILSDTVCLVSTMMVKELINSLPVALSSNHNLEGGEETSQSSIQDQSTLSTSAAITSETSRNGQKPKKGSLFIRIFPARTRKTS